MARKSMFLEYFEAILVAVVLAILLRTFVVQAYKIPSGSMLQTLQIGDRLLVGKFSYGIKIPFTEQYLIEFDGPKHGDIIVFQAPPNPEIDYVKRVIGVPGDVIEIRDKKVIRNNQPLDEPYVRFISDRPSAANNMAPQTIPAGQYFVMGDNRDASEDSRVWGTVPRGYIHGRAWIIYWSWDSSDSNDSGLRWSRLGNIVR